MLRTAYTDGACSGNPGPGGWAWAIAPTGEPFGVGGEARTTNQRMEIAAALEAVKALLPEGPVHIISDSTYVVNCFRDRWYASWQRNGWRNAKKQPVANRDLWEPLIELLPRRRRQRHLRVGQRSRHRSDEQLGGSAGGGGVAAPGRSAPGRLSRCGSGWTPEGRSPTWSPRPATSSRSPRCPTTPPGPWPPGSKATTATFLAHGTTVATNALLERTGAVVALVTNEGLEDVIEIGRQNRPSLYDQWADRPVPLVPRAWRYGVAGRLAADGTELTPLGAGARHRRRRGTPSPSACCTATSTRPTRSPWRAPSASGASTSTAPTRCRPSSASSSAPLTTVVNAYLRPVCGAYLRRLADLARRGAGDDLGRRARGPRRRRRPPRRPPAVRARPAACGRPPPWPPPTGSPAPSASTWAARPPTCASSRAARPSRRRRSWWAGSRCACPPSPCTPSARAAGRSPRVDAGGALAVGPASAGAVPGPACYGRGGTRPTVTDADLVLGRIPADGAFPGIGRLDLDAARRALADAGVRPDDVVTVVDAAMAEALRAVSVARGVDPAGLALVAFGGAGPLHACALADALGMEAVIVPARAGVLSAVGSPGRARPARPRALVGHAPRPRRASTAAARRWPPRPPPPSAAPGAVTTTTHRLPLRRPEPRAHRRGGRRLPRPPRPPQRLRPPAATRSRSWPSGPAPRWRRRCASTTCRAWPAPAAVGPTVIAEPDCTIWLPAGWRADPGAAGALILRRTS